jgi:hypothetical protein
VGSATSVTCVSSGPISARAVVMATLAFFGYCALPRWPFR